MMANIKKLKNVDSNMMLVYQLKIFTKDIYLFAFFQKVLFPFIHLFFANICHCLCPAHH